MIAVRLLVDGFRISAGSSRMSLARAVLHLRAHEDQLDSGGGETRTGRRAMLSSMSQTEIMGDPELEDPSNILQRFLLHRTTLVDTDKERWAEVSTRPQATGIDMLLVNRTIE